MYYDYPKRRDGTRKISGWEPKPPCRHPEHNPPSMRVFEPGVYEHTCPCCGKVQVFRVGSAYWLCKADKNVRIQCIIK